MGQPTDPLLPIGAITCILKQSLYMFIYESKTQTLQIFKELSFGMLMLWQVKSIGISPLQYPSAFDNLYIDIKLVKIKQQDL